MEALAAKILPKNPFQIKRRLADRLFSKIIRARDHFHCVRCGHAHSRTSRGLQASHFFSRRREETRFDWDNVDALCLACHLLWSREKRGEYMEYKKKQLGFMRYTALAYRAQVPNDIKKFDDKSKIVSFRRIISENFLAFQEVSALAIAIPTLPTEKQLVSLP